MKKIVIKVDDKTYEDILIGRIYSSPRDVPQEAIKAIRNGKVLPKGHGRLIDADAVLAEPIGNTYKDIDIAETIIEADKED